ncbi:hypothetical protein HYC85_020591 [Camellia sinensis]|uniref:Uncharacterized protein n=1 Tax=Camellia sinensis TaxID=4442 RepID=A0A7J7GQ73_CAMSI|nr:hypothetical protein HYC85_020591 [Camellia sinensis]
MHATNKLQFKNLSHKLAIDFNFAQNHARTSLNTTMRASLLDGMANTGMVELGEVQLTTYLAEKTFTGQPSFQNEYLPRNKKKLGLFALIYLQNSSLSNLCDFIAQNLTKQILISYAMDQIFALFHIIYMNYMQRE